MEAKTADSTLVTYMLLNYSSTALLANGYIKYPYALILSFPYVDRVSAIPIQAAVVFRILENSNFSILRS